MGEYSKASYEDATDQLDAAKASEQRAQVEHEENGDVGSSSALIHAERATQFAEREVAKIFDKGQVEATKLNDQHNKLKKAADQALAALHQFEKNNLGTDSVDPKIVAQINEVSSVEENYKIK